MEDWSDRSAHQTFGDKESRVRKAVHPLSPGCRYCSAIPIFSGCKQAHFLRHLELKILLPFYPKKGFLGQKEASNPKEQDSSQGPPVKSLLLDIGKPLLRHGVCLKESGPVQGSKGGEQREEI